MSDGDMEFLPEDLQRMLDTFDGVKDAIAGGQPASVEIARDILGAFGLPSQVIYRFAAAYGHDNAAMISEHGGNAEDVVRTSIMDGLMMGIALVVTAGADQPVPKRGELCAVQGHTYTDSTTCIECGEVRDCAIEGHRSPSFGDPSRCLWCGTKIDPFTWEPVGG